MSKIHPEALKIVPPIALVLLIISGVLTFIFRDSLTGIIIVWVLALVFIPIPSVTHPGESH